MYIFKECPDCGDQIEASEFDEHQQECYQMTNMMLTCPICKNPVKKNGLRLDKCEHCVCSDCFDEWCQNEINRTSSMVKCPSCSEFSSIKTLLRIF